LISVAQAAGNAALAGLLRRQRADRPAAPCLHVLSGAADASATRPAADNDTVNREYDNGANDRSDKSGRLTCRIPAHGAYYQPRHDRTCDTKQHRHNGSAWTVDRHHTVSDLALR